jgi:Ca2+-binding RTX toxin-like protein
MASFRATDIQGVILGGGAAAYYGPASGGFQPLFSGTEISVTWTRVQRASPTSSGSSTVYIDRFQGEFQYGLQTTQWGSYSVLNGGRVTGFQQESAGQVVLTAENLNVAFPYVGAPELVAGVVFDGDDDMTGSRFSDVLYGGRGSDYIRGLDGDDYISGGDGNDDLNGNQGSDRVYADAGADWARGGQGNDTVEGGEGDDPHLNGNLGDDIVSGYTGNDTVFGGQGDDRVLGGGGSDFVSGDLGNDSVQGEMGSDTLMGGPGADQFIFRRGDGTDWIGDFSATQGDRIMLEAGSTYVIRYEGSRAVIDLGRGDTISVSADGFSSAWITFG